jgi:hypothetical protein
MSNDTFAAGRMTWERRRRDRSLTGMLTPTVIEIPRRPEAVTRDDFADELETIGARPTASKAVQSALAARRAAAAA